MTLDIETSVAGLLTGNHRILAKTITLIESSLPGHQAASQAILERLLPHTGKAVRLGITGVPGAMWTLLCGPCWWLVVTICCGKVGRGKSKAPCGSVRTRVPFDDVI